jgi:ribosomal protein S18 acetylase RimI-like enzyme
MTERTLIQLLPKLIATRSDEFQAVCSWKYSDADSYVCRLLTQNIPHREKFGYLQIWAYYNPEQLMVGFGTLDFCFEYRQLSSNQLHPYIPLIAVNPDFMRNGHGSSIIKHLTTEAVLMAKAYSFLFPALFLDVYTSNEKAIQLYTKAKFETITEPMADPDEEAKPYVFMSKRIILNRV